MADPNPMNTVVGQRMLSASFPTIGVDDDSSMTLSSSRHPVVGKKTLLLLSSPPAPATARKRFLSSSSSLATETATPSPQQKRPRRRLLLPAPQQIASTKLTDATMVAPIPVVKFIQGLIKPKACGHCALCKAKPCGKCHQCLLNAKDQSSSTEEGKKKKKKKGEKRRCIHLKCIRTEGGGGKRTTTGEEEEVEVEKTMTMEEICEEIADIDKLISTYTASASPEAYMQLLERKTQLHAAKVELQSTKSLRKSRFPVGFSELWNVISNLEKSRRKFATFVAKQTPGQKVDQTERKRAKCVVLDRMIAELTCLWCDELAPLSTELSKEFWKLVSQPRSSAGGEGEGGIVNDKNLFAIPPPLIDTDDDDDKSFSSDESFSSTSSSSEKEDDV
jgi:hypothetical protein